MDWTKVSKAIKRLSKKENKKQITTLFLFSSPVFYSIVLNLRNVVDMWAKIDTQVARKLGGVFDEQKLVNIGLSRWVQIDSGWITYMSLLFYNRLRIFVDELFELLSYFFPRLLFQSGDGSLLSPTGVEPLPFVLLPFYLLGLYESAISKKYKLFIWYFLAAFLGYLTGTKSFAYLLPLIIITLYFASIGFMKLSLGKRITFMRLILLYGFYLVIRSLFLRYG